MQKQVLQQHMPMSLKEMEERGIDQLDFVYIIGDAYIDHSSFGPAIISRVLEHNGYTVGIISQPDWKNIDAFRALKKPRLAFLISAGNIDSMVNHYTASKKRRSNDAYTPGGKAGKRPDRATIVYANCCRQAYRDVPIIVGGIEASLRRFAHYDYWDNKVRRSILMDSGADILIYGMGERQIVAVAEALSGGLEAKHITYVPGTCYMADSLDQVYEYELLPSYEEVAQDKIAYCNAFMKQYENNDAITGKTLVQKQRARYLVANPPAAPLTRRELDEVYDLPYTRKPHPSYKEPIPALEEVEFSLISNRGCYGGCSFCALTFHQGRVVQSRSHQSILKEAEALTELEGFKGYIHDVGGPTANYRNPACDKQLTKGVCQNRQCIGIKPCPSLKVSHEDYISLLRKLRAIPKVKKVFVRSGVRYDYVMYDKDDTFLRELILHHISGQLKIAPEHVDDRVLSMMGKPNVELYDRFVQKYEALNKKLGKNQFIVPYFMSSHPGSDLHAAIELAQYLKKTGQRPEQVQDFYPTPGTLSTCMYYTGLDPRTMKPVYVAKDYQEKLMQRALLQWYNPKNHDLVRKALIKADREDLIGTHKNALVPPAPQRAREHGPSMKRPNTGAKHRQDKREAPRRKGRK